jgi:hypothetical protein
MTDQRRALVNTGSIQDRGFESLCNYQLLKMTEAVTLLISIREEPCSNVGRATLTILSEDFSASPETLRTNFGTESEVTPGPFPYISFPIHYSSIIVPVNAMRV